MLYDGAPHYQRAGGGGMRSSEKEYEFLFVVDGVSADDDEAVVVLVQSFDAVLSSSAGVHRLAVSGVGVGAVDAAERLVRSVSSAVPTLRLLRLDPELVGVSDIAERTRHSRQNVQQWVNGERWANRKFPQPVGSVGRSLAWRWADVNEWLVAMGEDDGGRRPTLEDYVVINAALMEWNARADIDGRNSGARSRGRAYSTEFEVHSKLIASIPRVTGRDLSVWLDSLESHLDWWGSPEDELMAFAGLPYTYAAAIVREYEAKRGNRLPEEDAARSKDTIDLRDNAKPAKLTQVAASQPDQG
jgi:predicted DNA-binding transcriptional regulator AlpA